MNFNLADAAKKVDISRSSIYRLIDERKLSATTDRWGKKVVELSELLRVVVCAEDSATYQLLRASLQSMLGRWQILRVRPPIRQMAPAAEPPPVCLE